MIISIPKALALNGAKYNESVHDWRLIGATSKAIGDQICITNGFEIAATEAKAIIDDGGEVNNSTFFVKVPLSKLTENVPSGLPNYQTVTTDEQGNVTTSPKKWGDYCNVIAKNETDAIIAVGETDSNGNRAEGVGSAELSAWITEFGEGFLMNRTEMGTELVAGFPFPDIT